MRKLALSSIALLSFFLSNSQINDTTVLIIPCASGELFIDGLPKGKIEANDALREKITFGEHYIQLKTAQGNINNIIRIDKNITSNIIRLGCEIKDNNKIRLIDKTLSLAGYLSNETENNYFGLDNGDELSIQCLLLNKKGTATISISHYETGLEIYKKEKITQLENEIIKIPKKGIYKIILYTDALFGKEAKLVVDRIPSKTSHPNFKTTVHFVSDTTATEVLNTTTRVYSQTNLDHSYKTILRLNLPASTTYWVYWIGVGQESRERMKQFTSTLSSSASVIGLNPLFKFGMKMIPALPMLNSKSTINYFFTDSKNASSFFNNGQYSYFTFKYGKNIATDYSLVDKSFRDLSLCLWNDSSMIGEDVEVKAVAFSVRTWLEMDSE